MPPVPLMPKLIPAPDLSRKRKSCDEFAIVRLPLEATIVPSKKNKPNETLQLMNVQVTIEKLPLQSDLLIKHVEGNFATHKRPRTKVTIENFSQISNMGFCTNNKKLYFKCFSNWCNFRANTKERFLNHLKAHHQNDTKLKSSEFCHECNTSIIATNLEEEFIHMISIHLGQTYSEITKNISIKPVNDDSSYESQTDSREPSVSDGIRQSIESEISIKEEKFDEIMSSDVDEIFSIPEKQVEFVECPLDEIERNLEKIFSENDDIFDDKKVKHENVSENTNFQIISVESLHTPKDHKHTLDNPNVEDKNQDKQEDSPEAVKKSIPIANKKKLRHRRKHKQKINEKSTGKTSKIKQKFKNENASLKTLEVSENCVKSPEIAQNIEENIQLPSNVQETIETDLKLTPVIQLNVENDESAAAKCSGIINEASTVTRSVSLQEPLIKPIETPKIFKRSISLQHKDKIEPLSTPLVDSKKRELQEKRRQCIDQLIAEEKRFNKISTPSYSSSQSSSSSPQSSPSQSPPSKSEMKFNLKIIKDIDLMPWISDPTKARINQKYELAYMNMIKKNPLIATFKCMGIACSYTTNDAKDMLNHLCFHEADRREKEKIGNYDKDYYSCCSYCHYKNHDHKQLVHHINDIHRKDIFQCGYCFYRSCEKQICHEHQIRAHKNRISIIYECPEREIYEIIKAKRQGRLENKRKQYVVAFRCKMCDVGIYPLQEFLSHMEINHTSEEQRPKTYDHMMIVEESFRQNVYGMHQCLYCNFGACMEDEMTEHLIEHPSEFGFYCSRIPPKDDGTFEYFQTIEATTLQEILPTDIKVVKFLEDKNILANKLYKQIMDSDVQSMLQSNGTSSSPFAYN